MNFYDCCDQKIEAKSTTKDAPTFYSNGGEVGLRR